MLYYMDDEEIEIPAFPRVTMCDFKIRVLGNAQRYTVQCVLPINLFNGMIYLFMWWWMVVLGIASVLSFFTWFWRIVSAQDRSRFVRKHLILLGRIQPREEEEKKTDDKFIKVEFSECSSLFLSPLQTEEYEPDAKATALTLTTDKYTRLKQLIKDQFQSMQSGIYLNPSTDTELLHEILQVDPEDARRKFEIKGNQGHALSEKFLSKLHQDGIFVLRIVGNNTNSITTTEVICALWDRFCERYYEAYITEINSK